MTIAYPDLFTLLTGVTLAALAVSAAVYDVRQRRIPNWLCLAGLILALLLRAGEGLDSLGAGLAGSGIAFLAALPLFLVRGLGGGDVKLLTAVGAFLGPERLLIALLVTAVSGGVLSALAITRRKAWRQTIANLRRLLWSFGPDRLTAWKNPDTDSGLTLDSKGAVTIPYAVAIGIGAVAGGLL